MFLISQVVFQRQPSFVLMYLCGCAVTGVIDVFVSVCVSVAPHLSSVAHTDESADWLESTGSTGQEVGAVVGLQEADEVGALRLQNTNTWTSVKALVLYEIQEKDAFYMVPIALTYCRPITIKVPIKDLYTLSAIANIQFALMRNSHKNAKTNECG